MSKWKMVYDTEHTCDGIDCDSFEEAKARWEDCLVEWMVETENTYPNNEDKWYVFAVVTMLILAILMKQKRNN
ncbi:MAG: hypothetical protein IJ335_11555, partial [Lachnospiraceae bacterium]|nr:hypothetical protein [Lachnospiraceae bacterium]